MDSLEYKQIKKDFVALSHSENFRDIKELPQEKEMVVTSSLLQEEERDLVKTTVLFAVQATNKNVFFVSPNQKIPRSFKLLRSAGDRDGNGKGKPIRLGGVSGG